MTREERSIYAPLAKAVQVDEDRRMLAYHQSLPVACWSWPVSDDDRRRAEQARNCADPDEARAIAWRLLADWQRHRCAVCTGSSEVLDHDHETGLVRGWLCRCCNGGEGSPVYIPDGQFERYRARNPASILGLTIRYFSPFTGWAEPEPVIDEGERLDRHAAYVLATRYGTRRDT